MKIEKILPFIAIILLLIVGTEAFFLFKGKYFFSLTTKKLTPATIQETHFQPPKQEEVKPSLGIDENFSEYVSEGDKMKRIWIKGIIANSPYLKDNEYYLPVAFSYEVEKPDIELILGSPNQKTSFGDMSSVKTENQLQINPRLIEEVIPLLKKATYIKFQIITDFDPNTLQNIKKSAHCDSQCQARLELIEKYYQINQQLVSTLRNGGEAKDIIVGPPDQILINN